MFYQLNQRCSNRSTGQGTGSMLHQVLLHNPGAIDENFRVVFIDGHVNPVNVRKSERLDPGEILDATLALGSQERLVDAKVMRIAMNEDHGLFEREGLFLNQGEKLIEPSS